MHIACPECGATNRVPEARLNDQPVCGRCGAQVAPTAPVALADDKLANYLAHTEAPVVVDFWAAWCGPCKSFAPHFAQAASHRTDIRFIKVDSDAAPQASARYSIRSIPTVVLFAKGAEVARVSGAMSAPQLLSWVDSNLASAKGKA